jgi:LPXTG-motif cell wall-anchored protein
MERGVNYLQKKLWPNILFFVCISNTSVGRLNFYQSTMGIHKITAVSAVLAFGLLSASAWAATDTAATATGTAATASALQDELNVPGAPALVSKTATSVTLSWAKVPAAASYIVKYSKNSVAEAFKSGKAAVYEVETDQITATGTTIKDLSTDTTYYFAVVALDKENNESATNSEELSVKLSAADGVATAGTGATAAMTGATASFKLSSVTATSAKVIALEFSSPVGTTPVTLKISKTLDNSAVAVATTTVDPIDPKKVTVALAGTLDPSSSYSVTVISAKDANGASIQEGVNAVKEFVTSPNLAGATTAPVALNAAPTESGATLSGATASGASVSVTEAAALPATGAKENLLLLLAAVLSFGIVYIARKKRA